MNNLFLTLALGVLIILVVHSCFRFLTSVSSGKTAVILLLLLAVVYTPLLIIDWPGVDVFAIQIAIYGITIYLLAILHSQAIIHQQNIVAGIESKKPLHWAPLVIVGFFVVVVSVDSIFITIAQKGSDSLLRGLFIPEPKKGGEVSSYFPGIIEHNYHEKEDQYNQYQQRLDKQRQRGWKVKYGWENKPVANQKATLILSLVNEKGQVIKDAIISGSFQRGNTSKQDQPIELKEQGDVYKVDVVLKYPGRWELLLTIKSPQGGYDIQATTEIAEQ